MPTILLYLGFARIFAFLIWNPSLCTSISFMWVAGFSLTLEECSTNNGHFNFAGPKSVALYFFLLFGHRTNFTILALPVWVKDCAFTIGEVLQSHPLHFGWNDKGALILIMSHWITFSTPNSCVSLKRLCWNFERKF